MWYKVIKNDVDNEASMSLMGEDVWSPQDIEEGK